MISRHLEATGRWCACVLVAGIADVAVFWGGPTVIAFITSFGGWVAPILESLSGGGVSKCVSINKVGRVEQISYVWGRAVGMME